MQAAEEGADLSEIKRILDIETKTCEASYVSYYTFTRSLNVAAKAGKADIVDRLLEANADFINRGHPHGGSAFAAAAEGSNFDVMERLLQAGRYIALSHRDYSEDAMRMVVENGQHTEVERLQEGKKVLESLHKSKCHALQISAGLGDRRIIETLIKEGADVNYPGDIDQQTALSAAAKGGHFEVVKYLLSCNAKVNQDPGGYQQETPLYAASKCGHLEIVDTLLAAGAQLNVDRSFHAAAGAGHIAILRRLLAAGARVEASGTTTGIQEPTALQLASRGGHLKIVQLLLQLNANVNAEPVQGGYTSLAGAAKSGSVDIVKILLAAGADINPPALRLVRRTALQAAAETGNLDIVNTLLDAGAKVQTEPWAGSALEFAAASGHHDIVERFLQILGNQIDTTSLRVDALYAAVENGHRNIVQSLLAADTPAVQPTSTHNLKGLLLLAASNGDATMVKILLNAKADPNTTDLFHMISVLQVAVEAGNVEISELLITAGANVNSASGRTNSPLHIASKKNSIAMVKLLLDSGADTNAVSYTGEPVFQAAENNSSKEIQILIQSRGNHQKLESPETIMDKTSQELQIPVHDTLNSLCSICSKLPLETFLPNTYQPWLGFSWHESLSSLQNATQKGCQFCSFFWRQLKINHITIPQPSPVPLRQQGKGFMSSQIQEPFPQDIERPLLIMASFQYSLEPFEGS